MRGRCELRNPTVVFGQNVHGRAGRNGSDGDYCDGVNLAKIWSATPTAVAPAAQAFQVLIVFRSLDKVVTLSKSSSPGLTAVSRRVAEMTQNTAATE